MSLKYQFQPTGWVHPKFAATDFPNEPDGYSAVVSYDGSQFPPEGFPQTSDGLLALDPGPGETTGDNTGAWDGTTVHSLETDATAPVDSAFLRMTQPSGATGFPGYYNLWGPDKTVLDNLAICDDRPNGFELEEMYLSYHFRYASGQGDGLWELGTHTKMSYFGFGAPSPGASQCFIRTNGFDPPQNVSSFTSMWLEQQGPSSVASGDRISSSATWGPINVDQWHQVELVCKLNDIGSANGTMEIFFDGSSVYTNNSVTYRTSSDPKGFTVIHVAPIWGDAVQESTRDDHLDYDHVRVSGIELAGVN